MVDEIKEKIDLVELISERVPLKRVGAYFRGLCPFHNEKTASFYVSPQRQMWHCFGCGESGDCFSFVMKFEGLDFGEVLRMLAERTGVQLVRQTPEAKTQKAELLEVNSAAQKFFQEQLKKQEDAREYLKQRGLHEQTIEEFGIGFAPAGEAYTTTYLRSLGFSHERIREAGFCLPSSSRDRFRSRIMFPIFDHLGRIVGFTGRIFPPEREKFVQEGKYVNSPENALFRKGSMLYGLHKSAPFVKTQEETIVVEGQMDFLMGWQAGMRNIVASSGTALTMQQLKLMRRFSHRLVLALDTDEAGERAVERSAIAALLQGFIVERLLIPEKKDIAEYLISSSPAASLLRTPIIEYFFTRAQQLYDVQSFEGKKQLLAFLLPKLKPLDVVDKVFWAEKVGKFIGVKPDLLIEEIQKIKLEEPFEEQQQSAPSSVTVEPRDRHSVLTEQFLALALALEDAHRTIAQYKDFLAQEYHAIAQNVLLYLAGEGGDATELTVLFMRCEHERLGIDNVAQEVEFLLRELRREYYRKRIDEISGLISAQNVAAEEMTNYLDQVKAYSQELKNLQ